MWSQNEILFSELEESLGFKGLKFEDVAYVSSVYYTPVSI